MNNEAMCETAREPKHLSLMHIDCRLQDILQRIEDLNIKLGVNVSPSKVDEEPVPTPSPDSLVSVLNYLPSLVNNKVTRIHELLNDLEADLN